jgi:hypothetical protein
MSVRSSNSAENVNHSNPPSIRSGEHSSHHSPSRQSLDLDTSPIHDTAAIHDNFDGAFETTFETPHIDDTDINEDSINAIMSRQFQNAVSIITLLLSYPNTNLFLGNENHCLSWQSSSADARSRRCEY